MVATTAFGMGIDAPHVRFVLHYGLPRGFEAFVQESGRAGRDGKAASCVLFYTREERDRRLYRLGLDVNREISRKRKDGAAAGGGGSKEQAEPRMQSLERVISYCESVDKCRHELIAEYFKGEGEVVQAECDFACDFCKEGGGNLKKRKERGLADEEAALEFSQREIGGGGNGNGWEGYEDA